MEAHEEELGPIDIVVIAYPAGRADDRRSCADAPRSRRPRDHPRARRPLRQQNEDGTVSGFEATDLDGDSIGDFKVFEGASSGLLGEDDVASAGETLEPGSAAVMIVYENRWAAPFAAAVRRNGGVLVANHRITAQELMDALDTADAVS